MLELESGASGASRSASRLRTKAHITELTGKYQQNSCDKDTMRKLTAYMFADGQEKEAHAIEDKFVHDCSASANVGPE